MTQQLPAPQHIGTDLLLECLGRGVTDNTPQPLQELDLQHLAVELRLEIQDVNLHRLHVAVKGGVAPDGRHRPHSLAPRQEAPGQVDPFPREDQKGIDLEIGGGKAELAPAPLPPHHQMCIRDSGLPWLLM